MQRSMDSGVAHHSFLRGMLLGEEGMFVSSSLNGSNRHFCSSFLVEGAKGLGKVRKRYSKSLLWWSLEFKARSKGEGVAGYISSEGMARDRVKEGQGGNEREGVEGVGDGWRMRKGD